MKPAAVNAILVTLDELWPGELGEQAVAVWTDKLSAFDDDDPNVRVALEACVEICTFRPTFAEFAEAYHAAKRATPRPRPRRELGTGRPESYCRECGGPYWSEANNMRKDHYPACSENFYRESDRVLGVDGRQYERVYGHRYERERPVEPMAFGDENPATVIKRLREMAPPKKAPHSFTRGQTVVVDRPGFGGTDPLLGKVGQFLGGSPDGEWLRVEVDGSVRLFQPSQLREVG